MTTSKHSRNNSHTLAPVIHNVNHRNSRRKSITSPAANPDMVTTAIKEVEADSEGLPVMATTRRHTVSSRTTTPRSTIIGSLPSPPIGLGFVSSGYRNPDNKAEMEMLESAIDDESNEGSPDEGEQTDREHRMRRASDGQPLVKEGRKSNRTELRCEKCGKGYKHGSCLTKHLWEHTPGWTYTSKLLISKHQQVQLLEAASVLVAMNHNDGTTPPDSTRDLASDQESASPAASGYSAQHDEGLSSAETTPPPQSEAFATNEGVFDSTRRKRYSSSGGDFSRSYQSIPSPSPFVPSSAPHGTFGFGRKRSDVRDQRRPVSSGLNATGQEDHDLAAAVELLSCSFGSSYNGGSRNAHLPPDAPPVPPLPAQYLDQAATSWTGPGLLGSVPSRQPESFTRGELLQTDDVKMEESENGMDDEDDDNDYEYMQSRSRSEEEEEGIFGRMEEMEE